MHCGSKKAVNNAAGGMSCPIFSLPRFGIAHGPGIGTCTCTNAGQGLDANLLDERLGGA
jgi:hypothetical protein